MRELEARLREGGGADKIARQHKQGKLTARERIDAASATRTRASSRSGCSSPTTSTTARRRARASSPASASCTAARSSSSRTTRRSRPARGGRRRSRRCCARRRSRCAAASRSSTSSIRSGVNLPYQGGVFPGQYGASRIFYYNSIMRRYLRIPQLAAVMGPCIAGGAYLPALSDLIVMVKGTSFMGLGGPNLVKGATGQTIDGETLGGAVTHNADQRRRALRVDDDEACIAKLRELVARAARTQPPLTQRRTRRHRPRTRRRRSTISCRPTTACRTTCTSCSRPSSTTASSTNSRRTSRTR